MRLKPRMSSTARCAQTRARPCLAHAGNRRAARAPRKRQRIPHVVYLTHEDDAAHRRAIQATGAVDRAAALGPAQRTRIGMARRQWLAAPLWLGGGQSFGAAGSAAYSDGLARRIDGQQRRTRRRGWHGAIAGAASARASRSHRGVRWTHRRARAARRPRRATRRTRSARRCIVDR